MQFYTQEHSKKEFPCIVLHKDNWDDYNYKITFDIYYEIEFGDQYHIGSLKILDSIGLNTNLPSSFLELNITSVSLGTSLEYYENLKAKFPINEVLSILKALNDIAFNDKLRLQAEKLDGYQKALLRFTSSQMLIENVKDYILENRMDIENLSNFTYKFRLPDANDDHKAEFDYEAKNIPFSNRFFPHRINAIIGKNGTGKTQYLASLVKALAGVENEQGFSPSIPKFNKVIAISYSIFDDFPKPEENNKFSYFYIGYRISEEVILTNEALNKKINNSLVKIIEKNRTEFFYNTLRKIIDIKFLGLQNLEQINHLWVKEFDYNATKKLSSGQSILFFVLTELISEIQPKSFILFDEPETHLHPTATSELIEALYNILDEFQSYALISTHSPLFLQNIPSRYIHVFDRIGNTPVIKKLHIETFGENVSEITDQVFDTINVEEFYKKVFNQFWLTSDESLKELFVKDLSFNAKLYLNSLKRSW